MSPVALRELSAHLGVFCTSPDSASAEILNSGDNYQKPASLGHSGPCRQDYPQDRALGLYPGDPGWPDHLRTLQWVRPPWGSLKNTCGLEKSYLLSEGFSAPKFDTDLSAQTDLRSHLLCLLTGQLYLKTGEKITYGSKEERPNSLHSGVRKYPQYDSSPCNSLNASLIPPGGRARSNSIL